MGLFDLRGDAMQLDGWPERIVRATWPDRWNLLNRLVLLGLVLLLCSVVAGIQLMAGSLRWGNGDVLGVVDVTLGVVLAVVPVISVASYFAVATAMFRRNPSWRREQADTRALARSDEVLRTIRGRTGDRDRGERGHRA